MKLTDLQNKTRNDFQIKIKGKLFISITDLNENEAIANNNDDLCLSMESSPDKAQHCTLPDPIDDIIPQFDGGADEKDDSSPRKGIYSFIQSDLVKKIGQIQLLGLSVLDIIFKASLHYLVECTF